MKRRGTNRQRGRQKFNVSMLQKLQALQSCLKLKNAWHAFPGKRHVMPALFPSCIFSLASCFHFPFPSPGMEMTRQRDAGREQNILTVDNVQYLFSLCFKNDTGIIKYRKKREGSEMGV